MLDGVWLSMLVASGSISRGKVRPPCRVGLARTQGRRVGQKGLRGSESGFRGGLIG